jgi:hypothetical protein
MGDERFQSDRQNDPIAELARLIAQSDTYGERASVGNRFQEEIVSDGYNEPPEFPPAPQLPVDLNELEQACELRSRTCASSADLIATRRALRLTDFGDRDGPMHIAACELWQSQCRDRSQDRAQPADFEQSRKENARSRQGGIGVGRDLREFATRAPALRQYHRNAHQPPPRKRLVNLANIVNADVEQ